MAPSNTPRPTNAERRATAREQARQMREAQAKKEKRNRQILVVVLVVVMAVVAVAVTVIIGQAGRSQLDSVTSPAGADDAGGIVVGADGVGVANADAPVVRIYSDFMCPFCAQFEIVNGPVFDEVRLDGDATVVYHPVAFLNRFSMGTLYSTRSAQAVAAVAEDAPEQFVEFWNALFLAQPAENTPGLSDEQIAQIAVGVGVPQEVADTFTEGRFNDWVDAASEQATRDLPRPATPTVVIEGEVWEGDWRDPENLRAAILGG